MGITFRPLQEYHFTFIYDWFNQPHVQAFYSLRAWTYQEVLDKYTPYLCNQFPISAFIIYVEDQPIGYIQKYAVKAYPWPGQDLDTPLVEKAAGIDLFIGDSSFTQKGLGKKIMHSFLEEHIWPYYEFCLVDPDCNNTRSIHFFDQCGFKMHKIIATTDTLNHPVKLHLMIKRKTNSPYR